MLSKIRATRYLRIMKFFQVPRVSSLFVNFFQYLRWFFLKDFKFFSDFSRVVSYSKIIPKYLRLYYKIWENFPSPVSLFLVLKSYPNSVDLVPYFWIRSESLRPYSMEFFLVLQASFLTLEIYPYFRTLNFCSSPVGLVFYLANVSKSRRPYIKARKNFIGS
jgi:hypothetical protein